jgi:hypothetical protein
VLIISVEISYLRVDLSFNKTYNNILKHGFLITLASVSHSEDSQTLVMQRQDAARSKPSNIRYLGLIFLDNCWQLG